MYVLALFFYVMAILGIKALRENQGEYTIPDFIQSGYGQEVLIEFRNIPQRIVERHYYLDSLYIRFYALASTITTLASRDVPAGIRWVPAILGLATGILDSFENYILKSYYYNLHKPWMPKIVSRVTRTKAIFAWGWFTAVPIWLIWQALAA